MSDREEDNRSAADYSRIESWSRPWRIGLYLALFLLAILLLVTFIVEPIVRERLQDAVHESTRQTYLLEMDDLDINLYGGGISLHGVLLRPDSTSLDQQRIWQQMPGRGTLSTDRVTVGGFSYTGFLFRDKLNIGTLIIESPKVEMTPNPQYGDSGSSPGTPPTEILYKMVNSFVDSARLDRFEIRNAGITLRDSSGGHVVFSLSNANLALRDIVVDSARAADSTLFITDRVEWGSSSFAWNMGNGRYRMSTDSISLSTSDRSFSIDSLRLVPLYPKYEFAMQAGTQTDRVDLVIPKLRITGIEVPTLMEDRVFVADLFDIRDAALEVYHDMRPPAGPPKKKELLYRKLDDLPLPVRIDTARISSSSIHYIERQEKAPRPGISRFESLNADLVNLSSALHDSLRLHAESMVMGEGKLVVDMNFLRERRFHTIEGHLDSMAITAFNPILAGTAFMEANTGQLHGMEFSMQLNEQQSTGTLTMDYQNFAIKVLDKESLEQSTFEDLKTFLANTFVVNRNNHDPAEEAEIHFERIPHKSIFNYWWKSLYSGIKNTIGL